MGSEINFGRIFSHRHHYGIILSVVFLVLLVGIAMLYQYEKPLKVAQQKSTGTLIYQDLLAKNPKLSFYNKSGICRENLGFAHFFNESARAGKSRVNTLTFKGELIGILFIWPASEGWFPYADQPKGKPLNVTGRMVYMQTIYFKNPPTKEDCASATS